MRHAHVYVQGTACLGRRSSYLYRPEGCFAMLKLITNAQARIASIRSQEEGATAVEYGLMVALIAVVIIAGVTLLGGNLLAIFNQVAAAI
jgi:pilus assembly protein Flp/PilA